MAYLSAFQEGFPGYVPSGDNRSALGIDNPSRESRYVYLIERVGRFQCWRNQCSVSYLRAPRSLVVAGIRNDTHRNYKFSRQCRGDGKEDQFLEEGPRPCFSRSVFGTFHHPSCPPLGVVPVLSGHPERLHPLDSNCCRPGHPSVSRAGVSSFIGKRGGKRCRKHGVDSDGVLALSYADTVFETLNRNPGKDCRHQSPLLSRIKCARRASQRDNVRVDGLGCLLSVIASSLHVRSCRVSSDRSKGRREGLDG